MNALSVIGYGLEKILEGIIEMAKEKLNPRHEKFIQGILEGKTRTQAYIDAGYSPKQARQNAHRLMTTNEYIKGAVEAALDEAKKGAKIILELDAEEAAQTMTELRKSGTKDDFCRMYAAKDILDRAGTKAEEKVQHTGEVRIIKEIVTTDDRDTLQGQSED